MFPFWLLTKNIPNLNLNAVSIKKRGIHENDRRSIELLFGLKRFLNEKVRISPDSCESEIIMTKEVENVKKHILSCVLFFLERCGRECNQVLQYLVIRN